MSLPRMRGIAEAFREIKEQDPGTAITLSSLRVMVKEGKIPSVRAGHKYLINMALLESYLSNQLTGQEV